MIGDDAFPSQVVRIILDNSLLLLAGTATAVVWGAEERRQLAKQVKVEAWLTEDNCHFLRIGSYRS